jgi:hypothetical protein
MGTRLQAVDFPNTAAGFTHEIRKIFRKPVGVQYNCTLDNISGFDSILNT